MVDSMSTSSSLELTRNPFDVGQEERVNCPGFSPSMFIKQETPASQKKKKAFRWSIEQISRLNPADIDEFPHQEYSSTFEREEDEIQAQKAVDEYFSQSFIVPSPWTPNYAAKHVKFSPLPPTTAYIEAASSTESSYSSPTSSNCKIKADASSQTKLSLPPDFDLQRHIDPTYYNQDGLNGSKDISLSSLRRKLFGQIGNVHEPDKYKLEPPTNIKSILKSPKSPVLITSSPVSEPSTPKYTKHRNSTASTMSSPNMSPIKPMLSVHETPTSAKSPCMHRQSFSPMECSTDVLNSSGIDIIGEDLPDLSPIKGNTERRSDLIQRMDTDSDAEDKENANDSVDDGGPLEVSALSVRDDGNSDENEGDDDEEMPPKITMEDLADDLDSTSEESFDHVTDSPEAKFKELSPRENSTTENAITEIYDRDRGEDICGELPKPPKDSRVGVEDTGSTLSEQGGKGSNYYGNGYSKQSKDKSDEASKTSSQRNWQARDYSPTERYLKSSHPYELDEDIIMMRAKAALRRANRYSPPKGLRGHFSDPHSLSLSDLSLNALSAWEPVHVSTPLIQPVTTSNDNNYYRNYADHVGYYSYKSTSGSHWHDIPDSLYDDESWLRRNVAERTAHHHSVSGKRLSPAVEEVIQQRKLQEKHGGRYAFSTPWRKPSSPLYHNKWQLSRTHPMSYVEWKALYWRPQREPGQRRERHWYHSDPYEPDLRRLSWPPKPTSSKLVYGSRPLSPPVSFPPAKVPRAIPEAYVSKMALPSYHNSSDSGYSDWQQSNSQWENTMRSRHSSLDYVGGAGYYLRQ